MSTTAKKSYPTALPHRAPDDLAAECDRWRRRTFGVIFVAITILAIAIPLGVYWISDARSGKRAAAIPPSEESAPYIAPSAAPEPILASPPKKIVVTPPGEFVKKSASIAATSQNDIPASQKEAFLEALGSLSAAHLFQSYLNIGLLADGVESEAYTPKQAEETLLSIAEMMDQADAQLTKLSKTGLDPADEAVLRQIRTVTELLRLQAKYLKDYWRSGDMEQAKQYHEIRQAAWKGLTKVLQVDAR